MRREAILILLLLASAGCVTTPGSSIEPQGKIGGVVERVLDLGKVLEASIPLSDGLKLHGTVYLPDVPDGEKVPVVMDLGPYYGNLGGDTSTYSTTHPPSALYEHLLRRGYAIALVSVRGTGLSEGCFMIGGPQERADAAAAVEWLAAQGWSDGNVAMTGVSYDGTTPWEAYVSGAAPHLKAIIPVEGISDHYRYSFFEGVPVGGGASFNTYYLGLVDVAYTSPTGAPAWAAAQPSNLCPEQADVYLNPYHTYLDGVHGPYWDERDASAMAENATAAVFVVHGLKDFNVKMDQVQTIWDKLPEPKRMLLGQWEHNIPWSNSYDKKLSYHDYNATMDAFLDAHVRGDAAALAAQEDAPNVTVQTSGNRTLLLSRWPPAESVETPWFLGKDVLATTPADKGEAKLQSNPAFQVLRTAGIVPSMMGVAAPDGSVTWISEAFSAPTLFAGNPWIALNVSVDQPRGSLEARLYDVHDDGERELISMGWQNLAVRESRDKSSDVPTGQPMQVRILMEAIAQEIPQGHRLALALSSAQSDTTTPQMQATTFAIPLGGPEGAALMMPAFPTLGS